MDIGLEMISILFSRWVSVSFCPLPDSTMVMGGWVQNLIREIAVSWPYICQLVPDPSHVNIVNE